MRRVPALATAFATVFAAAALVAVPAIAHQAPRVRVASPENGARVYGGSVRVVVEGEGGNGPGLFTLALDGTLVDATGRVGGTFTTLSVQPNSQTVLTVPVSPGEHELRLTQQADPDSGLEQREVVTRFTVTADGAGSRTAVVALAALVAAGGVGAVVAVRRRAALPDADVPPPGEAAAGAAGDAH